MSLILAGTGCGSPGSMTIEVRDAAAKADVLIGAKRLLEGMPSVSGAKKCSAIYAEDILKIIKEEQAEGEKNICILYSGDSGFYSGTSALLPLLDEAGIEAQVLPGISSIQLFAARLQTPWQDWELVSAHGTDCDPVANVMKGKPAFFLTGGKLDPQILCQRLTEAGLEGLEVVVGEKLSYDDERIVRGTAGEFAGRSFAPLSVMLAYPAPSKGDMTPGIDDDEFIRGDVPMTKQDVRASIISHMKVQSGDTVWDVGAGTGSVSVELAMKASAGKVYAIERGVEGASLINQNKEKFGVWNLTAIEGSAPETLTDLPAPDRVFIGGSSGNLSDIIDAVLTKNDRALICISAIVLETLHEATAHLTEAGLDVSITQIAASKTRPIGGKHMMIAINPIYIITGQKND